MESIVFTSQPFDQLHKTVSSINPPSVHVITDTNVSELLPQLPDSWHRIVMQPGENHKTIEAASAMWQQLHEQGASRHSLIINIGGGIVSDVGGFVASAFKRGLATINLPTTLLAAIDASIGGKTGINFSGLKNQIGTFHIPRQVIISNVFFSTLPQIEYLSGYGEMLKHGLLAGPAHWKSLLTEDLSVTMPMLKTSVMTKQAIVEQDPTEQSLRKALNLGHTFGHALEELKQGTMPHGFCVAYGLMVSMALSHIMLGFPSEHLYPYAEFLKTHYLPHIPLTINCNNYETLWDLMRHDKKNHSINQVSFTLLQDIGLPLIDQFPDHDQITSAIDITRDLLAQ